MKIFLSRVMNAVAFVVFLLLSSISVPVYAEVRDDSQYIKIDNILDKEEQEKEIFSEKMILSDDNTTLGEYNSYDNEKVLENAGLGKSNEENNNYPIVLVHGFLGYGRDEALGYKYWGGFEDIEQILNNKGYTTYTAAVGPISSNWDRTCELYAYLVGGTVDYGAAHSAKYGHARYGRTYKGIYKNISDINKIHLIGHSMGGQTIRMFTQLLSEGSEEEKNYEQDNLSPLFTGGKHWVRSVTTISAPHDGCTILDLMPPNNYMNKMYEQMATINGQSNLLSSLFDFKLDQFGLVKQDNESEEEYINRVLNSSIWNETKDIGTYDLTTKGAEEINKWVKAQSDVYYFSWVTEATKKSLISNHQIPQIGAMNPQFYGQSFIMGRYTRDDDNLPKIDEKWFANDGCANTISQNGPKLGSNDKIEEYDGNAKTGQWNVMMKLKGYDHMDIVGRFAKVDDLYSDYAEFLSNLPK